MCPDGGAFSAERPLLLRSGRYRRASTVGTAGAVASPLVGTVTAGNSAGPRDDAVTTQVTSGRDAARSARVDDARITALALRAREGDRAAAGEFVAVTQHQVWRLLVHLADPSVAEELAQETYERALGSLRRYRGDAPARSWLLSIARR
ncbi:MAG: hypothetical protein AVDCRST_MAG54-3037, partial [uncultured Actinomycetospora sp.]